MIKQYSVSDFLKDYKLLENNKTILNVGSSSVRYGNNCFNVDIQSKPEVDLICDIHNLPASIGEFDGIICNAVLQYCQDPQKVIDQLYQHLKTDGYLFVDAPWIQPFCYDTPDRFRFSEYGLKQLSSKFHTIKAGPSILSGSAFVMLGAHIALNLTRNKYLNLFLSKCVKYGLYPLHWVNTVDENKTAGAFYIICQKTHPNPTIPKLYPES